MPSKLDRFKSWLELYYSDTTREAYIESVERFLSLVGSKTNLSKKDLQDFVVHLKKGGLSHSSIHRHAYAVVCFYEFLNIKRRLDGFKMPKTQSRKLPVWYKREVVKNFIDATTNNRDEALIRLMYSCALRLSEVVDLNKDDVDYDEKDIRILDAKGGKSDTISVDDETLTDLKKYVDSRKDECEALFVSGDKRLHPSTIQKMVKRIGNEIGIHNAHPHAFRHSRATHLWQDGVPIETISKFLRHSRIDTTMIYTHIVPRDLVKAIPAPSFGGVV